MKFKIDLPKNNRVLQQTPPLREKFQYSEFSWSLFSRIQTDYAETRSIFPYSVGMRENADQENSEYGHFLRGALNI